MRRSLPYRLPAVLALGLDRLDELVRRQVAAPLEQIAEP